MNVVRRAVILFSSLIILYFDGSKALAHVPLFFWSPIPNILTLANTLLSSISKETLIKYLVEDRVSNATVIAFVSSSLSAEDFSVHARKDLQNWQNLLGNNSIYTPQLESPTKAIDHLSSNYSAMKASTPGEVLKHFNRIKLFIVEIPDSENFENRDEFMRRLRTVVHRFMEDISKSNISYMALLTGKMVYWPGWEDRPSTAFRHQSRRILLEADNNGETYENKKTEPGFLYATQCALVYVVSMFYSVMSFKAKSFSPEWISLEIIGVSSLFTQNESSCQVNFETKRGDVLITFDAYPGKWIIREAIASRFESEDLQLVLNENVAVYRNKSYSCSTFVLETMCNRTAGYRIAFHGFQVQPFDFEKDRFSDYYDCDGFMSIPVLTGLLVGLILVSILMTAIAMLASVKTPDRFDNVPKSHYILATSEF